MVVYKDFQDYLSKIKNYKSLENTPISIGDIRGVHSDSVYRVCLISSKVFSYSFYYRAFLIHPFTQIAGDKDVVIEKSQWNGEFDIVVQSDISLRLLESQITPFSIGQIPARNASLIEMGTLPNDYSSGSSSLIDPRYKDLYLDFISHELSYAALLQQPYRFMIS